MQRMISMDMTPHRFRQIRQRLKFSKLLLARALGYEGNRDTARTQVQRMENGSRDIRPWIARLMIMFDHHGVPSEFRDHPDFDDPNPQINARLGQPTDQQ